MSKLLEVNYESNLSAYCDIVVEKAEFSVFSAKVQDQVLKSVKIDGFRPGKAPADKAMQNVDPQQLIQTIIQETVKRYLPESVDALTEKIEKIDGKKTLEFEATLSEQHLGMQEDGSFKFRLNVKLLPVVDVSKLKSIKVPVILESDLPKDRTSLEQFLIEEKKKLLDNLNSELEKGEKDKVDSIDLALDQLPDAKKVIPSEEKFVENVENMYQYETEYLNSTIRQRKYIESIISDVPDFEIPESTINPELERIVSNIIEDAEKTKSTLADLVEQSGIPNYESVKVTDKESLEKVIRKYIFNEYKLMFTLRYLYETEQEQKVSNDRITEIANDMKKNSDGYRVPANLDENTYHNLAFDRLMRASAIEIVNRWAVENSSSITKETEVIKVKSSKKA